MTSHNQDPLLDILQGAVNTMQVPDHKKDVRRHCLWLIRNLEARNSGHPRIRQTMLELVVFAESNRLLKASEIKELRDRLNTEEKRNPVVTVVHGAIQPWELVMLAAGGRAQPLNVESTRTGRVPSDQFLVANEPKPGS